jgi:RHS repeat-associated protein
MGTWTTERWGPDTDELLADESKGLDGTAGNADDTAWALTDQVGSVRKMVAYNAGQATFVVVASFEYDSFGNLVSGSASSVAPQFLYTGRLFDAATGLQNNLHRWYDPVVGRWVSIDPIGFEAGNANLYGYVGNSPTTRTDPRGLKSPNGDSDVEQPGPGPSEPAPGQPIKLVGLDEYEKARRQAEQAYWDWQQSQIQQQEQVDQWLDDLSDAIRKPPEIPPHILVPGPGRLPIPPNTITFVTNRSVSFDAWWAWWVSPSGVIIIDDVDSWNTVGWELARYPSHRFDMMIFSGHGAYQGEHNDVGVQCQGDPDTDWLFLGNCPPWVVEVIQDRLTPTGVIVNNSCEAGHKSTAIQAWADLFQHNAAANRGDTECGNYGYGDWIIRRPITPPGGCGGVNDYPVQSPPSVKIRIGK